MLDSSDPKFVEYYRDHPADFISDWGVTFDPRNHAKGRPSKVRFSLFPRQREWVETVVDHWKRGRPLLTEKSRDVGLTWLSVATACTLCLFNEGLTIGFGASKDRYVVGYGEYKSIFYKLREFLFGIPNDAFAVAGPISEIGSRISFNGNGSSIVGESRADIGRLGKYDIYFLDEVAFFDNKYDIDSVLSRSTKCRVDISTPNGMNNSFAKRRHSGEVDVFTFGWWDDPRKDEDWYRRQSSALGPEATAMECDIRYNVKGITVS